jgi:hypothetical protein
MPPPSMHVLTARTTASASTLACKEQIHAAVANAAEPPPGLVRPAGLVRLDLGQISAHCGWRF